MNSFQICARGILGAFLFIQPINAMASDWFESARQGELQTLEKKVEAPLLNSRNEKGYTAFVLATYNNQQAYAEKLLMLGADPCLTDNKGNTALMGVIFKGHDEIAYKIIDKCDVNQLNNEGQTALMYASLFGREKMAKKLISLGAKTTTKDREGRDAIQLAESQWNQAMVSLLKTFRVIN